MNLDVLKEQWAEHDRRLGKSIRLNAQLLRRSALDRTGTALGRFRRFLVVELVVNFALIVALGAFNVEHLAEPRFLVPGAVLHLAAILLLIVGVRRLVDLVSVDLSGPVVAIQKALARAERLEVRTTLGALLVAPLLWLPMLIVGLEGLFGVDTYAYVTTGWLAANFVFGLTLIPLALWASRRYADRIKGSPRLRRLMRDLAGRNLAAAARFVDEVSRFEDED